MRKNLENTLKEIQISDQYIKNQNLNPNNFCIVPFTNIILEPDGKIGICRQKGHNFSIGNIKDGPIHKIWNNEKVQSWRQEFLTGRINTCTVDIRHEQCNRCPENNELLPYVSFKAIQSGPILKLTANLNGQCNLKCQMCDVWKLPNGLYDQINFWEPAKKEIFPHLREIDMLSGEPFIQSDTFRLIHEVTEVNTSCKWTFTTNAHYLFDKNITDSLDKIKIKTIIVSIDSFTPNIYRKIRKLGNLETALQTLDQIIKYRNKRNDFNIYLNFLIQKDNWKEVFEAINFCYKNDINPFLTFLYEPNKFSLLSLEEKNRIEILDFFLSNSDPKALAHLKKSIMPLIDSLNPLDKIHYLLDLRSKISSLS